MRTLWRSLAKWSTAGRRTRSWSATASVPVRERMSWLRAPPHSRMPMLAFRRHTRVRSARPRAERSCPDGFWNYATDADAVALRVRSAPADADAESVAKLLVQFALDGGGVDNVTVAVVHLPTL